ncbi:MAG: hypothetical protein JJU41_01790 [Bacteroidetes bacterium]|nr:hypothetical protein [Bacteroidota bacterium]MCH8524627.1 hypothetical protein [Balneolales bacterium]
MVHEFSSENLNAISDVLGVEPRKNGGIYRFSLENTNDKTKLVLEIQPELVVDGVINSMISVYSHNTFLQLQNCVGFVASELLHQVTFFGKTEGTTSGLIIEREAGCSFYANVEDSILKGDFTKLPPELMTSSIALSLTENIDLEGFTFDEE